MDKYALYVAIWNKWGKHSQLLMLAEECSELIKAALKQDRDINGAGLKELTEEIADVEICIEQVKHLMQLDKEVTDAKRYKLMRLQNIYLNNIKNGN